MIGPALSLGAADWLALFLHFATLSLLAVGGAITTAPDMHRFLVDQRHWLSDPQFSASIAIAQAAPGPNVLFVALMGWNVGLNAGGYATAALGLTVTMVGVLLPSSTLTYLSAQWGHRNRHRRSVRAFKAGMAPIVVALLVATGWVLAGSQGAAAQNWRLWLLTAVVAVLVWRTRLHLLWLLGAGALLGGFGLV
ncbi:MAG: chromate transporter [Variovorax paradoxus]|nr:MAG: chromate transporter [Variovorax paradoxus]PZQ11749.1 MAG: chromate transporter [Variovorax paradoxus]